MFKNPSFLASRHTDAVTSEICHLNLTQGNISRTSNRQQLIYTFIVNLRLFALSLELRGHCI